ncbi:mitochondrial rhomboid protease [Schizosaccharomyces osmophilus]|uniref:Mitochondrial rhomboid protease n=1 Tax=Schizosaccharomyces osmophilus TaxID=2545709 RepID=A0AAE9WB52_9SCHI|nr:mitochondrial rhomboid protease [Schizosaccharomyces osmophilus]WBW73004.1 mitochondrial rhomboid protease [Schizosaccharomyces osmophilus]
MNSSFSQKLFRTFGQKRFYYRPWIRIENVRPTPLWKPLTFAVGTGSATFYVAQYLDKQKKPSAWNSRSLIDRRSNRSVIYSIIGINVGIFALWRIPAFHRALEKYAVMNPTFVNLPSIIVSAFSHQSGWHLLFNMMAFYSFAPAILDVFGKNQFLAFYTSSILFSNLASLLHNRLRYGVKAHPGSLGASGAIYAIAAATAYFFPNASVSIIFLPFIPIKIGVALLGLMAFDTWGLVSKRFAQYTFFDHAAHLGGGVFGWLYAKYGYSAYNRSVHPRPPPSSKPSFSKVISF